LPSGRRHYRLTLADALSAHERALQTGGLDGILNIGMIESALARPYNGYYPTIERKTAALVESMSTNHGFVDGTKRTTVILTHLLLSKSGYRVNVTDERPLDVVMEELVLSVVCHELKFDQLVDWFKTHLRRL
jgi:death on curing protein